MPFFSIDKDDEKIYEKFVEYCDSSGYKIGKSIIILIQDELKKVGVIKK